MEYISGSRVRDIQIAYIGGGSRGWAWTFMTDLAMEESIGGTIRLYDIDRGAAEKNEVIGNRLMSRPEAKGDWKFETKGSLKDALTGADFVVISILPGTFDEMESDVHLPERLGIWQSVGDTAGPGGMIRGLRTVPMFVEIAEAIRDYSPEAWVINYTNPMTLLVKTLYTVFPGIKAFGCCHEVFGTQKMLQGIYEAETGDKVEDWHEVMVNVVGINHFTWFTEASVHGRDLFPIFREYINKHFDVGFSEDLTANWVSSAASQHSVQSAEAREVEARAAAEADASSAALQPGTVSGRTEDTDDEDWTSDVFACRHRVKMDLFMRYGAIGAAGDRHLSEFMPGDEYLKDPETAHSWKFNLTPVSWRKEDLKSRLERSERLFRGEEEIDLKPTGEEGILLIKALLGLTRVISNVNIPNSALQIPNLPADAVVETNAVFSRDSVRPVAAGALSAEIKGLILPHVENHERTYNAAVLAMGREDLMIPPQCGQNDDAAGNASSLAERCREMVVEGFFHDPLVAGHHPSEEDVRALANDMIDNTLAFLPAGWKR